MKVNYINGGTRESLEMFQKKNNTVLPREYYEFLIRTNGVIFPENTTMKVDILEEEIELDSLFGIIPEKKWLDLNYENDEFRSDLPYGAIVIGRDLMGGHIIMMNDGDEEGIYYWDDALNFSKSTDQSNAYLIAGSFKEFSKQLGGFEASDDNNSEYEKIIPLGSVVLLHGGIQKLLVISRAINVNNNGQTFFFDYGAVLYPDGLISDKMAYFNQKDIEKVLFEGCKDDDNDAIVKIICDYKKNNPNLNYGNAQTWNQ